LLEPQEDSQTEHSLREERVTAADISHLSGGTNKRKREHGSINCELYIAADAKSARKEEKRKKEKKKKREERQG